jgi:hypothetical protein
MTQGILPTPSQESDTPNVDENGQPAWMTASIAVFTLPGAGPALFAANLLWHLPRDAVRIAEEARAAAISESVNATAFALRRPLPDANTAQYAQYALAWTEDGATPSSPLFAAAALIADTLRGTFIAVWPIEAAAVTIGTHPATEWAWWVVACCDGLIYSGGDRVFRDETSARAYAAQFLDRLTGQHYTVLVPPGWRVGHRPGETNPFSQADTLDLAPLLLQRFQHPWLPAHLLPFALPFLALAYPALTAARFNRTAALRRYGRPAALGFLALLAWNFAGDRIIVWIAGATTETSIHIAAPSTDSHPAIGKLVPSAWIAACVDALTPIVRDIPGWWATGNRCVRTATDQQGDNVDVAATYSRTGAAGKVSTLLTALSDLNPLVDGASYAVKGVFAPPPAAQRHPALIAPQPKRAVYRNLLALAEGEGYDRALSAPLEASTSTKAQPAYAVTIKSPLPPSDWGAILDDYPGAVVVRLAIDWPQTATSTQATPQLAAWTIETIIPASPD